MKEESEEIIPQIRRRREKKERENSSLLSQFQAVSPQNREIINYLFGGHYTARFYGERLPER